MTTTPLRVRWEPDASNGPAQLVVTSGSDVRLRAPAPPALRRPSDEAQRLPGVDLDVVWLLHAPPPGVGVWVQAFRDGLEHDGAPPCRHRIELAVRYEDMVRLCYLGTLFGEVLSPDEILPLIAPLSCLVGLLQGPGSARLGLLSSELVDAMFAAR